MLHLPEPIIRLTAVLSKLPGIGPRSSERLALWIVQADKESVAALSQLLLEAREQVTFCSNCGALTQVNPCLLCTNDRRNSSLVCVVERAVDIFSIEKSGTFQGRYHVLGGKLSPINGVEPEDLRIAELEARLKREPITELILALGTDVEGDATSHYLATRLRSQGVKLSRIAHGLPAGTGLEFADNVTLGHALEGRRAI